MLVACLFPFWEGGLPKPSFDKHRLMKTDLIIVLTVDGVPLISKYSINNSIKSHNCVQNKKAVSHNVLKELF